MQVPKLTIPISLHLSISPFIHSFLPARIPSTIISGAELGAGDTMENFAMSLVLEVLICQWKGWTSNSSFGEIRSSGGKGYKEKYI